MPLSLSHDWDLGAVSIRVEANLQGPGSVARAQRASQAVLKDDGLFARTIEWPKT